MGSRNSRCETVKLVATTIAASFNLGGKTKPGAEGESLMMNGEVAICSTCVTCHHNNSTGFPCFLVVRRWMGGRPGRLTSVGEDRLRLLTSAPSATGSTSCRYSVPRTEAGRYLGTCGVQVAQQASVLYSHTKAINGCHRDYTRYCYGYCFYKLGRFMRLYSQDSLWSVAPNRKVGLFTHKRLVHCKT